jgi:hypothetical protein
MTSRAASLSIVILLWAALYLPLLGLSELRGKEGKRVIPAVQMLADGNYLVPYLGARPYLNNLPCEPYFFTCARPWFIFQRSNCYRRMRVFF